MRALVTGHKGFIGRHVFAALEKAHDVVGLDREGHDGWMYDLANEMTKARSYFEPEAIVHMAAHPEVANWEPDPWDDDVDGLHRLLREMPSIRRFVFFSSSCVYGDDTRAVAARRVHVSRPLRPVSLYGASKLAGEALVTAFAAKRGYSYAICRPVAVFGWGMKRGHVVDFVNRYRKDGKVTAWDDGSQTKWGVHVQDVVDWVLVKGLAEEANVVEDLAGEPWGWKDTARLMGIDVAPGYPPAGFVGDALRTHGYDPIPNARPVEGGVQAALDSLGWVRP